MPVEVCYTDIPTTVTAPYTHSGTLTVAANLQHTTGNIGFYGATPVGARASASSHASSVVSASSYITVGSNLAAFAADIAGTLVALGIWS